MKKQQLAGILAVILVLEAGCGQEAGEDMRGEVSMQPTEVISEEEGYSGAKSGDEDSVQGVLEDAAENESQDKPAGTLQFFELPQERLAFVTEATAEGSIPGAFRSDSGFAVCAVDGMEYAALDGSFLSGADEEETAYFLEQCPELNAKTKLFLRRRQGEAVWEAAVLPGVSGTERNEVRIAFYSKENGLIALDGELEYRYSEPMRIWGEGGKLFMQMRARAEDAA